MDFDWLEWPNRINKYIENSALQFDLIDLGMCTVLFSDLQKTDIFLSIYFPNHIGVQKHLLLHV